MHVTHDATLNRAHSILQSFMCTLSALKSYDTQKQATLQLKLVFNYRNVIRKLHREINSIYHNYGTVLPSASSGANYITNELFIIPSGCVLMKIYTNWTWPSPSHRLLSTDFQGQRVLNCSKQYIV